MDIGSLQRLVPNLHFQAPLTEILDPGFATDTSERVFPGGVTVAVEVELLQKL